MKKLKKAVLLFLIGYAGFMVYYAFSKPYTIALDPGHGGWDVGAEGIIQEVELTERTVSELEALLADILGVPAEEALEKAFALFDAVQPRKPLKEFGISDSEFQGFAEGVMAGQTRLLNNNYVPLTVEDMVEIYQSVY